MFPSPSISISPFASPFVSIHGIGLLVDGPVFVPVFIHGNGLLVDRPVFMPVFVHGFGFLVDG